MWKDQTPGKHTTALAWPCPNHCPWKIDGLLVGWWCVPMFSADIHQNHSRISFYPSSLLGRNIATYMYLTRMMCIYIYISISISIYIYIYSFPQYLPMVYEGLVPSPDPRSQSLPSASPDMIQRPSADQPGLTEAIRWRNTPFRENKQKNHRTFTWTEVCMYVYIYIINMYIYIDIITYPAWTGHRYHKPFLETTTPKMQNNDL